MAGRRRRDRLARKLKQNFGYGCGSGKRRFTSRSAAYDEMVKTNAKGRTKRPLRDVYECRGGRHYAPCGGWHTSSNEPRRPDGQQELRAP